MGRHARRPPGGDHAGRAFIEKLTRAAAALRRPLLLTLGFLVCAFTVAGQGLVAPFDGLASAVRDQLRAPLPPTEPAAPQVVAAPLPTAPVEPVETTPAPEATALATPMVMGPTGPVAYIPILMYHYIRYLPPTSPDVIGRDLSVSPERFREQMAWLAANGYHTITSDQLYQRVKNNVPVPARSVVLTFDDGYADFYTEAWPVLKRYHFTATNYVINHKVDTPGYLKWPQIQQLAAEGATIGAHTLDHVDLAIISLPAARGQVVESRRQLEAKLGHPVVHFAYPSGRYNRDTVKLVEEAGFLTAVTTNYGMRHTAGQLFLLQRIRVHGAEELREFVRSVSTPSG